MGASYGEKVPGILLRSLLQFLRLRWLSDYSVSLAVSFRQCSQKRKKLYEMENTRTHTENIFMHRLFPSGRLSLMVLLTIYGTQKVDSSTGVGFMLKTKSCSLHHKTFNAFHIQAFRKYDSI